MSIAMETAPVSVSSASGADLNSDKPLEQSQHTLQMQLSCSASPTPPLQNASEQSSGVLQSDLSTNISTILNASKNNDIKSGNSPVIDDDANSMLERELEVQQKAFQRFTSSLNDLRFRSTFPINVFPPFLAALQQNPLTLHNQFAAASSNPRSSGVSPGLDDEDENEALASTEPEDLTINFRKDKKECIVGAGGSTGDDNADSDASGQQNWSYEEQFKQLYELSDDVKRKEWLDDWLGFMHRIGKPVTRIPIMAKQVLDLYELYRLVVQHGGLVEIINKKLWREITRGLNLPSSITSAAFTLRTQYQKYLYDYECEKEGLSTASDLQQAIDGNRREGRRNASTGSANYPQVGYSVAATAAAAAAHHNSTALLNKHLNGTLSLRNGLDDDAGLGTASQQAALVAAYHVEQLAVLEAQQRQFERAQRAAVEAVTRHSAHTRSKNNNLNSNNSNNSSNSGGGHHSHMSGRESTSSADSDGAAPAKRARNYLSVTDTTADTTNAVVAAAAAAALNDENGLSSNLLANLATERLFGSIPSAHLKITSRGENSLVVSMEINGTMYQGVLFALGGGTGATNMSQNPFQNVSDAAAMVTGLNLATTLKNPL
uniref:ARID domain-containing protein n=1 Tax=Onchocerca volvulus TaxID=6282 RepID=A0A8R1XU04_ONCVO